MRLRHLVLIATLVAHASSAAAQPTPTAGTPQAVEPPHTSAEVSAATEAARKVELDTRFKLVVAEAKRVEGSAETAEEVLQTSGGIAGLSRASDPVWSILADTNVSSIDVTQPSAGIGLEYATPFTLVRISLKKNVSESTLTTTAGARDIGRAILRPSLANASLSLHYERRLFSFIRCHEDCSEDANSAAGAITSKWSAGGFASLEVADLDTKITDDQGAELTRGHMVPLSLTAGITGRIEGVPPESLKAAGGGLMIAGYAGLGLRAVSGDLRAAQRTLALGTSRRIVGGPEVGVAVQLGNVILDGRITGLSNFDDPVPGLTGVQFQAGLTFVLPLTVIGKATATSPKEDSDEEEGGESNRRDDDNLRDDDEIELIELGPDALEKRDNEEPTSPAAAAGTDATTDDVARPKPMPKSPPGP